MHSEPGTAPLRDILHHLELAEAFVSGFDAARFREDMRTIFAVTRCLEIISEASRRLPASLKEQYPEIPWKQMAAAGNVYRHDYEEVAANYVWDTVKNELPPLRVVIERALGDLE